MDSTPNPLTGEPSQLNVTLPTAHLDPEEKQAKPRFKTSINEDITFFFKWSLAFVLITVVVVGADLLYRDAFFPSTINAIQSLQENSDKQVVVFFNVIENLGHPITYFVLLIIFFNFLSRQNSLYLSLVFDLALVINLLLQNMLETSRPFLQNRSIIPYECSLTFGDPSMEICMITTFVITLVLFVAE